MNFDIYDIVISIFLIGASFYLMWLWKRNNDVCAFRIKISHLCHDWCMNRLHELATGQEVSAYDWLYKKLPSYNEMFTSFRPLTLDEWIDENDLKRLFQYL